MRTKRDGRQWVVAVHVHTPGKDEAARCEVLLTGERAPAKGRSPPFTSALAVVCDLLEMDVVAAVMWELCVDVASSQ